MSTPSPEISEPASIPATDPSPQPTASASATPEKADRAAAAESDDVQVFRISI